MRPISAETHQRSSRHYLVCTIRSHHSNAGKICRPKSGRITRWADKTSLPALHKPLPAHKCSTLRRVIVTDWQTRRRIEWREERSRLPAIKSTCLLATTYTHNTLAKYSASSKPPILPLDRSISESRNISSKQSVRNDRSKQGLYNRPYSMAWRRWSRTLTI